MNVTGAGVIMGNDESEHNYFSDRLVDQIRWYSGKARDNKKKFYLLQAVIIVLAGSITIVNALRVSDNLLGYVSIVSSILGGTVVIITALVQMFKYQENWILYRTTSELLKKEKYYYLNDVGPYSELNAEQKKKLLVERVETVVSAETSKYFTVHKPEKAITKS